MAAAGIETPDSTQSSIDLYLVWSCIAETERAEFWRFAAKDALLLHAPSSPRKPVPGSPDYDGLCSAIRALERSGTNKSKVTGLPRVGRRLAPEELSKGVARFREKLLDYSDAHASVTWALCRWVQSTKLPPLLSVLDSLGCAHHENGGLIGAVPSVDSEEALSLIVDQVKNHRPQDLALTCGALILNHKDWAYLGASFLHLKGMPLEAPRTNLTPKKERGSATYSEEEKSNTSTSVAQAPKSTSEDRIASTHESDAIETFHTSVPATLAPSHTSSLDASSIASLRSDLQVLKEKLLHAITLIALDELPKPKEAVDFWLELDGRFCQMADELSISSRRLPDLQTAIQKISLGQSAKDIVDRSRRVRHISDPSFPGIKTILQACDDLSSQLDAGGIDHLINFAAPLSALLKLVQEPESFNDDAASALSEVIREALGNAVATAALRGKLFIDDSTLEITGSPQASSATEVLGEAIESKKIPPAPPESTDLDKPPIPLSVGEVPTEDEPETTQLPGCADASEEALPKAQSEAIDLIAIERTPAVNMMAVQPPIGEDVDFAKFRKRYWLNDQGDVAPAPWSESNFSTKLESLSDRAWSQGALGIAYLFSSAASKLGVKPRLDPEELFLVEKLLENSANLSAARLPSRVPRLRQSGEAEIKNPAFGISLLLEALAPTHPFALTAGEITDFVNRANYSEPTLKIVVTFLLNGWASAIDPLDILRDSIQQAAKASPAVLANMLSNAQENLRNEIAAQWSAAGGRLKHTHSRKAWTDFVRLQVGPLRDELAPQGRLSATPKWSVATAREKISQLGKTFQRIMDAGAVKHQDRVAAIHAAEQIVASVEHVVEAMQRLANTTRPRGTIFLGVEPENIVRLLAEQSTAALDHLCIQILRCVLQEKTMSAEIRLPAGYLVSQPNLIRTLESSFIGSPDLVNGISISRVEYPEAAAALLVDWTEQEVSHWNDSEQLLLAIRNAAADNDRWDLLAALSPSTALQAHERTLLHRRALTLGDEAYELARRLERTWGACDEMLAPGSGKLKLLVDDASFRTTNGSFESPIEDSVLLHNWISRVLATAERERDSAVDRHIASALLVSKEMGEQVKRLFADGNYRAAVALLHGGEIPQIAAHGIARRTAWRRDALDRYTKPKASLVGDLKGHTTEQSSLVNMWAQGDLGDTGYKDTLRRLLYQVISGEAGRSQAENQRRFPVKLSELREHQGKKTIIHCAAVREYFRKARLNPTFLPQLADYQQIVLTSTTSITSNSANFLDSCSKAAAQEGPGTLVVFLEPDVSESRRDELCSGLRRRGVPAAILDDVDLCRLCAVDSEVEAHNFIPFLEVIFEQLDLENVSPFSSLDGQHVRIETYIGRVQAAQQIALGWSYTRVFSGRKLGKSAFLRHVANTYNGERLPSGNKLNVFFITIAGGESEVWVVNYIIDEMTERFTLAELESSMRLPPAERFSRYMKRFMQTRPNDNVLLVLDEADSFVEGQLASYNEDREGSLSFRMMKELPSQVDSSQMPRVRIVFSGYRVTNTRGGVWANAGDVLVLKPLAEDEAVQFLRGMFARIGIDLGDHAPFIARRCGFQPAVLIRFGESLLKRLKRLSSGRRETLVVSLEEVRATMNEQSVLDEIRTVVNNNFQGNRIGAAIFGAALLALKDLQPGMALADGPSQVLEQLVQVDANLDWLERLGSQPLAQVERQLQDFIERELLTVSDAPRFGVREYRLKFPHFLPVLTQQTDVAIDVRQQIQLIRAGTTEKRMIECILPDSALDLIRYWFHQPQATECAVVVVASQWSEVLLDAKCGLPDRLGFNQHFVSRNVPPGNFDSDLAQGIRLFGGVDGGAWSKFLSLKSERPLIAIGGVDLLRLAKQHVLSGGDTPIDVVALGRIPDSTLSWWFESVRSLHFKTPNAIAQISKATNGVPLLVASFDKLLKHAAAADVTQIDLELALKAFTEHLPEQARELISGPPSVRISKRELELLSMAMCVGAEVSEGFDLERDFAEYWAMCEHRESHAGLLPPMSDANDRQALEILTSTGLLHASSSDPSGKKSSMLGHVRIEKDGVISRMLALLED